MQFKLTTQKKDLEMKAFGQDKSASSWCLRKLDEWFHNVHVWFRTALQELSLIQIFQTKLLRSHYKISQRVLKNTQPHFKNPPGIHLPSIEFGHTI